MTNFASEIKIAVLAGVAEYDVQGRLMSASRRIWAHWTLAFTLGELIGFGGIPVLGAAIATWFTSDLEPTSKSLILYAVAVVGGLGEGAVLGWFQSRVLSYILPELDLRKWVFATAAAASLAWACGMLAPTLDDLVGLTTTAQIAIWIPAGAMILLSIGSAQAFVLRGIVSRPSSWIVANVVGWLAGLPWTFALPAALPEDAPVWVWIGTFIVSGVLMGATAGAVTGLAVTRLGDPHVQDSVETSGHIS